jgi:hypothetical protein
MIDKKLMMLQNMTVFLVKIEAFHMDEPSAVRAFKWKMIAAVIQDPRYIDSRRRLPLLRSICAPALGLPYVEVPIYRGFTDGGVFLFQVIGISSTVMWCRFILHQIVRAVLFAGFGIL